MFSFLALGILALGSALPLRIIDEHGAPISHARVTFISATGEKDVEYSSAAGMVSAKDDVSPVRILVEAQGFAPLRLPMGQMGASSITLERAFPLIGVVRVATGSPASLHRLPVAASVLDRAALAGLPASTTDGLLRSLPGVDRTRSNSAFTNYGQLRVSFNGAGNDRGAVLVDGVPAQDGFGGQVDWAAYPADEIVRAELLRGAGSALYGSGAIGGVLALQTRGPQMSVDTPPEKFLSLGLGGYDGRDAALFVQSSGGSRLKGSLWTSTTQLAYYDFPAAYASKVSVAARSQSDATHLRLHYGVGKNSALSLAGIYSTDTQYEGRPNYNFARNLRQYALGYEHQSERTAMHVTAYQRDASVVNVNDSYPIAPGTLQYTQRVPSWEQGASVSFTSSGRASELQLRAEGRGVHGTSTQTGADGTLQSQAGGSQSLTGWAAQETLRSSHLEAVFGARYDVVAFSGSTSPTAPSAGRVDDAISPRAALRVDVDPHVALRFSSGAAFRAPYLNELLRSFSIGKTQYASNIGLIPERSHTDSAGVDVLHGNSRVALDVSSTKISNGIGFVTLSPTLQQRGNINHLQTDGTTLTFTQELSERARLRLGATTQYARVTAGPAGTIGKRPAFVPDRSATLGLDLHGRTLTYGADVTYSGQTYADDLNTQPLGRVLLFGLRANAPLSNGAVWSAAWQNVTNQYYLTSIDRLGMPMQASLRYTFPLGERTAP